MSTTYVRSNSEAVQTTWQVLEFIQKTRHKFDLVIVGITEAPARLLRQGVTILVTIRDEGLNVTEDVPFRVESPDILQYRFCTQEVLTSWRRKRIYTISAKWCTKWETLLRKVHEYLKSALNCLRHKQQRIIRNMKRRNEKRPRRENHNPRFVRPDACLMFH